MRSRKVFASHNSTLDIKLASVISHSCMMPICKGLSSYLCGYQKFKVTNYPGCISELSQRWTLDVTYSENSLFNRRHKGSPNLLLFLRNITNAIGDNLHLQKSGSNIVLPKLISFDCHTYRRNSPNHHHQRQLGPCQ